MDKKEKIYVHCATVQEWRNWLKKNHLKENSVALIINKKHTGKGTISHLDSMKEAICFGWIDTTIKRLDENKYIRHFRRRTDKSTWSNNTLSYAKSLLKENRMYPEGIKRYKEGMSKPTLDHGIPKNPKTPKDVKEAIKKENKDVQNVFKNLSKSQKRMYLRNIIRSKTLETRKARINHLITFIKSKNNKSTQ